MEIHLWELPFISWQSLRKPLTGIKWNSKRQIRPISEEVKRGKLWRKKVVFAFPAPQVYSQRLYYYNLSLYSTRTQNTWRRGLALGSAADARILRYPTQNIPTCWYMLALPPTPISDANPKICVSPDANPRRQSVEYRWRWAFWRWGWRWACTFHVVYVNFLCVGHPMQTRFSVEYGLYISILWQFFSFLQCPINPNCFHFVE